MLSLLTPEYQKRMTQMNYHEAVNNAPQWMASFCFPEGLMRWWYVWGIRDMEVLVTPNQVQFLAGVADNFIRKVLIDQEHSTLIPQWYGESVGFWDERLRRLFRASMGPELGEVLRTGLGTSGADGIQLTFDALTDCPFGEGIVLFCLIEFQTGICIMR
jgi:hypothetical protein